MPGFSRSPRLGRAVTLAFRPTRAGNGSARANRHVAKKSTRQAFVPPADDHLVPNGLQERRGKYAGDLTGGRHGYRWHDCV